MADERPGHDHHQNGAVWAAAEMDIDPVCGMKVDPATSKHRSIMTARTFHFCSARCREKFIGRSRALPQAGPAPRRHRRRARSTPARCIPRSGRRDRAAVPICGMALEPLEVTGEAGPNPNSST